MGNESPDGPAIVDVVRAWRMSRAAADRHNRNLLQYGGAAAAVLGISGASGGLLAVANALTRNSENGLPTSSAALLWAMVAVNAVLLLIFSIPTGLSFIRRRKAEAEAEVHLEELITLDYTRFLPSSEEVTQQYG